MPVVVIQVLPSLQLVLTCWKTAVGEQPATDAQQEETEAELGK